MSANIDITDRCKSAIEQWQQNTVPSQDWLNHWRQGAYSAFVETGLPTKRWEDWKYTDIQRALAETDFQAQDNLQTQFDISRVRLHAEEHLFVFVNGVYAPSLSDVGDLNGEFTYFPLTEIENQSHDKARRLIGSITDKKVHPFTAVNDLMFRDGLVLDIPDGQQVSKPIHLLYLSTDDNHQSCYPRLLLMTGKNSVASVVEHFANDHDNVNGFTNALTEMHLDADSQLHYYRLNREKADSVHVGGVHAMCEKNAHLDYFGISGGNKMTRNDLRIHLNHPHAECDVNGVYLCTEKQHVDNHITIEHASKDCSSRCLFKGSADKRSRAVFNGRVHIHPHAEGTNAVLYSKNLLLSPMAEVDTKPELEIYNDNVKAAHGATVSQIDDQQVHYLRSRGINRDDARTLLNYAFLNDVVQRIASEPVKDIVNEWVLDAFAEKTDVKKLLQN